MKYSIEPGYTLSDGKVTCWKIRRDDGVTISTVWTKVDQKQKHLLSEDDSRKYAEEIAVLLNTSQKEPLVLNVPIPLTDEPIQSINPPTLEELLIRGQARFRPIQDNAWSIPKWFKSLLPHTIYWGIIALAFLL